MEPLISFLKKSLNSELPGQAAQAIMMPTLSDNSRFSLEAKKEARPGGVMILFYQKNNEWYFPLIQRPDYDGVHAKQMSFPGGKMDDGDGNLTNTALRETFEEVGVEMERIEVLGAISELYIIASNFNVLPVVGLVDTAPQFIPDAHEVDEVIEVKLSDLLKSENQKVKPLNILQGITIQAPYFDLNDKVVWGATAMILSELKFILQPFFAIK
jgi:8-oxo-dGTP pyrophosphatase MutT (NUDIX family)